ncbi:MAG: spore coat protein CotJB [Ruminococcaceae bacterium]|nr:spore coat protein CotJB [Oscillospiraceae bacterium]
MAAWHTLSVARHAVCGRSITMNNGYTNRNSAMSRKELWDAIGSVSFAMDELRLFLDTHPDCAEALSLFSEYSNARHELLVRYTQTFGPLDSYTPGTENGWTWNCGPMPWSTEVMD